MARYASRRARGPQCANAAKPERINLYDEVTARIIAQLEAVRIPWVQPWASSADPDNPNRLAFAWGIADSPNLFGLFALI